MNLLDPPSTNKEVSPISASGFLDTNSKSSKEKVYKQSFLQNFQNKIEIQNERKTLYLGF